MRIDFRRPLDSSVTSSSLGVGKTGGGRGGITTAVTILAVAGSGGAYVLPSAKWGAPLLLTAAGALLGMVVDRAHKGERVLYRAP